VRIIGWLRRLDVDSLAEVCRVRAQVHRRPPETIEDLARLLSDPESVAATVAGLDRDAVLVAQSVVVLGDGCEVARLRAFVRDPHGVLDATVTRLAGLALVWPGEQAGTLRFSAALGRYWRYPLELGTPARVLANMMDNKDTVRAAARRLGVKVGNTRDDAARSIATALADPEVVAGLAGQASAEARALLDDLAFRPQRLEPPAGQWEADRYGFRPAVRPRDAAEQLYDFGLLLAGRSYDSAELPREAALVLRGAGWGPQLTGPPTVEVAEAPTADAETNALAAVEAVGRLLARVERAPLPVLKKGGIGVRDLRRLAGEVGADQDETQLWLALADRAGLLGLGDGGYRPTRRFDGWRAGEAYARWVVLAEAWQRLSRQRTDPVPPPLPPDTSGRGDAGLREGVMAVLTELPERSAVVGDDLAGVLAWRLPSADTSPARVATVLAETDLLGLTAGGALSALGRGLVAGRAEQAARAVFPAAASTVALRADLTAVADEPVVAQTAATLDRLAEPAGQGGWQFTRDSVRRALDDGHSRDEILAALESVAAAGVPQTLADLVGDLARVHGQMRVADCGCCVIADDPQVIGEIVRLRLGLRRVAPTVAVGRNPAAVVLAALRRAGYAPVTDPAGGQNDSVTVRRVPELRPAAATAVTADGIVDVTTPEAEQVGPGILATRLHVAPLPGDQQVQVLIDRLRDAGSPLGYTLLPDEEVRLLAEAAERGTAVWIKYESVFSASGKTSWLLLDELHIKPCQVVAWCSTRQKEESFPLYSIRSVEPVLR
jgi:hypothetical protein